MIMDNTQIPSTSYISHVGVFNGKDDFSMWKKKMKCVLIQQRTYKAVLNEFSQTDTKDYVIECNNMAMSSITLHLSDSVNRKIGDFKTAKELWDALDKQYTDKTLPAKMLLLENFFKYKLDLNKDMDDNLDNFTKLVQQIKSAGDEHIDDYVPIVLLNATPESYNDVKSAIKFGRDTVDLDVVVNGLKSKEIDLKQHKNSKSSDDKVMQVRGRSKKRFNNNKTYSDRDKSNGRSKSRPRETRKCYNCDRIGHLAKFCRKPKRDRTENFNNGHPNAANGTDHPNNTNMVREERRPGDFYVVVEMISLSDLCATSTDNSMCEWLVDSGCTYHMSPYAHLFTEYAKTDKNHVTLANDRKCAVNGVGTITLQFGTGASLTLKNVRHVPDLTFNLMSCSALEEEGLVGRWGNGVMKIMKGFMLVFKAEKRNNLYICSAECVSYANSASITCDQHDESVSKPAVLVDESKNEYAEFNKNAAVSEKMSSLSTDVVHAVKNDKTILWHNRLGHMSNRGLGILKQGGVFGSDCIKDIPFCEHCLCGKQHKMQFPHTSNKKESKCLRILEYIHADVWGPASIPTQGGNRYFLSLIDDFSRKCWVLLLKQKSDVFETMKNWMIMIEKQTDKTIKVLRTDNGLEFVNQQLNDFCAKNGIKRHLTVPYTPQQNGVVEIMNRTILERVRCMLAPTGLSKRFWGRL